jgi:hypothetical protein
MNARHFGYELALVAIVCVIGIFLFPAPAGSYSAVHGPVTAFQAMRNAVRTRWALTTAALSLLHFAVQPLWSFRSIPFKSASFLGDSSQHTCILRC